MGLTSPRARTTSLGTERIADRVSDLAGHEIEDLPGRDRFWPGEVPDGVDGSLVGAQGGQAGGDVGYVAVGVGQIGVADEVGSASRQGVGEDACAQRGFGHAGAEEVRRSAR